MSDEVFVRCCAPTLAGLKTGTIFNTPLTPADDISALIRRMNRLLTDKGLRLIPVAIRNSRLILYLYRVRDLEKDLASGTVTDVLSSLGYPCNDPAGCVKTLIHRLRTQKTFPHEIGFFLGFPTEDVIRYMHDPQAKALYTGLWKVYTDIDSSLHRFAQIRQCTDIYCEHICRGTRLEQLIVQPYK